MDTNKILLIVVILLSAAEEVGEFAAFNYKV